MCRQILSFSICLHIPAQPFLYLSVSSYMTRGQPPQDQIFFLLNDGFIRQISCSSDSEPSVIEIYPCVNSLASHTGSRAMEGCHCGLPSKYELEMSADLRDLLVHIPAVTFPSKGQSSSRIVGSPRASPEPPGLALLRFMILII